MPRRVRPGGCLGKPRGRASIVHGHDEHEYALADPHATRRFRSRVSGVIWNVRATAALSQARGLGDRVGVTYYRPEATVDDASPGPWLLETDVDERDLGWLPSTCEANHAAPGGGHGRVPPLPCSYVTRWTLAFVIPARPSEGGGVHQRGGPDRGLTAHRAELIRPAIAAGGPGRSRMPRGASGC
jgi:hypothetical protein